MSKTLNMEQVMAERDALVMQAASAHTAAEHLKVLSDSAKLEVTEKGIAEGAALKLARIRGAAIYGAYVETVAAKGGKADAPKATDFASVVKALSIPERPAKGETGKLWQGLAYQTLEQAYAFHQYDAEDSYVGDAYTRFLATADAEQVTYLGARPASLIGRLAFVRRAAKGTDGIVMPSSGTVAAKRDALVSSVIEAANGKIAARGATAKEQGAKNRALVNRVDTGASAPLVPGVAGLWTADAKVWTDDQIDAVVAALKVLKGRERPEGTVAPEQVEQVEQVTALAAQAEQVPAPDPLAAIAAALTAMNARIDAIA